MVINVGCVYRLTLTVGRFLFQVFINNNKKKKKYSMNERIYIILLYGFRKITTRFSLSAVYSMANVSIPAV